jgi:hypothetical protein
MGQNLQPPRNFKIMPYPCQGEIAICRNIDHFKPITVFNIEHRPGISFDEERERAAGVDVAKGWPARIARLPQRCRVAIPELRPGPLTLTI